MLTLTICFFLESAQAQHLAYELSFISTVPQLPDQVLATGFVGLTFSLSVESLSSYDSCVWFYREPSSYIEYTDLFYDDFSDISCNTSSTADRKDWISTCFKKNSNEIHLFTTILKNISNDVIFGAECVDKSNLATTYRRSINIAVSGKSSCD